MSELKTVLIRGGVLIDPANNIEARHDLLLRDGKVAAIETPGGLDGVIENEQPELIDATGLTVAPGLVDIHVHLREPGQEYKETIATGTRTAAAGGFATVCCMPNTIPVNDTAHLTEWMQAPERDGMVRVHPIAAATVGSMGEQLTDYNALRDAGAVGVSDDGKPILGDEIMRAALIAAVRASLPVIQHAEDTRLTGGCSMNAGPVAFRLGLRGMTVEAEAGIVERDIRLLEEIERETGERPHLHVAHISTARALDAVKRAKESGLNVTCEVAPHHFALTDESLGGYNTNTGEYDTNYKMNPPLRVEADRAAMLAGLIDGSIDAIATDHAPHAAHEKEVEFERAPNGITGLETALGLALKLLHRQHKLPLARVISLLSAQPASLLELAGAGSLQVGAAANVILFDPAAEWVFHARRSRSKSKNTPFDGWRLPGPVHYTISQGRVVYSVV